MQLLVTIGVFVALFALVVIRLEQNAKRTQSRRSGQRRIRQQPADVVDDEAFGGAFLSQSLGHTHATGPLPATRGEMVHDVGCETETDISNERELDRDPVCRVEVAVQDNGDDDD